jgi:antitoxin (DNA-binding transcriptional repressor) of toxin-antitoxin stability system
MAISKPFSYSKKCQLNKDDCHPQLAGVCETAYSARMTTTLSQSQADLPRLVELASQGEDVLITVEGKPKARLTRAESANGHQLSPQELQTWLAELADLRARLATGKTGLTAEQLVAEDREDRV